MAVERTKLYGNRVEATLVFCKRVGKYVSMPTPGEMAAVLHLACDEVRGHGTLTSMLLHGLFVCLLK